LARDDEDDEAVALGEVVGVERETPLAPQDRHRDEE
jgi:hypothetical protein